MTDYQESRCEQIIDNTAKTAAKIGVGGSFLSKFMAAAAVAKRAPLAALEIKMVIDLAKVFGRSIDESIAQAILSAALATAGGKVVAGVASDVLGFIPLAGEVIGGATAYGTVKAVGNAVVDLLDSGEFDF